MQRLHTRSPAHSLANVVEQFRQRLSLTMIGSMTSMSGSRLSCFIFETYVIAFIVSPYILRARIIVRENASVPGTIRNRKIGLTIDGTNRVEEEMGATGGEEPIITTSMG